MSQQQGLPIHVTIKDIMTSYQLSRTTVVNAIRCGELKAIKVGRSWRISLEAVTEWIHSSSREENPGIQTRQD